MSRLYDINTPFFFAPGRGKVGAKIARACSEIARQHECEFVSCYDPGQGHIWWFETSARGSPRDEERADRCLAAIDAAGIDLPGRPARSPQRRRVNGAPTQ